MKAKLRFAIWSAVWTAICHYSGYFSSFGADSFHYSPVTDVAVFAAQIGGLAILACWCSDRWSLRYCAMIALLAVGGAILATVTQPIVSSNYGGGWRQVLGHFNHHWTMIAVGQFGAYLATLVAVGAPITRRYMFME